MSKRRLAIVDDNRALVTILVEFFQVHGFDVVGFDGISHIEQLAEAGPDVVMLDLLMPQLTGQEIMQAMSRSTALSSVPVIVFSNVHEQDRWPLAEAVIEKPFDLNALLDLVRHTLQGAGRVQ